MTTKNKEYQTHAQNPYTADQKLGVALVGLGAYSSEELGPALKETLHCYLAAVVTDHQTKRQEWKQTYNIKDENLFNYENFDLIGNNRDIDIVYIVLPNALHAEFAIRAAKAGKHVICEKPLATTVEDCKRIIDACSKAGVQLSMGYRLHFDPYNREMMRLGKNRPLGKVNRIIADDSMYMPDKNHWRLKRELAGGGPLMNNGIYCVQAAQFITGEVPIAVMANYLNKTDPDKFESVEEGIQWQMEFASGTRAFCESSYNRNGNLLRAETDSGWFQLEPAYEYRNLKGLTLEGQMNFPELNQQAVQLDDFAICIKNNEPSRVPGEMGLRDMDIIEAIYKSADTGEKIPLHLEEFEYLNKFI